MCLRQLNLLILVSLLCAGLVQAQDADDPELQALIKTYKAMKAKQNATPKAEPAAIKKLFLCFEFLNNIIIKIKFTSAAANKESLENVKNITISWNNANKTYKIFVFVF